MNFFMIIVFFFGLVWFGYLEFCAVASEAGKGIDPALWQRKPGPYQVNIPLLRKLLNIKQLPTKENRKFHGKFYLHCRG